ncbi:hypothetical protein RZ71_10470 [Apilactobacillus kunkeei]|uniref:Lreu-0056-like domain-containing protein n=1 Tax=Apilactobacillus kunkeei TaxID=148814 RepID=A0A0M9DDN3_9LACO|nr:hypothetical protein [Apilactobacillus kunkeei]KOY77137.1 hypothetical protein RZ71_10470 [Apilactobacillus kunkeei]
MLKKTLYIIGLASLVSLVLVGCGKSQASNQSSKTNGAGPTSKKVATSSTTSTSSSSMSSTSGSNQTNTQSLDDRTIGLLAYEWVQDEQAKAEGKKTNTDLYSHYTTVIKSKVNGNDDGNEEDYFLSRMCYNGQNSQSSKYNPKNYSSLNFNGDGVADISYSVQGSNVNIKYTDSAHLGNRSEAEAPKANSTVSIDSLVKTYYSTPAQKQHVNNFGNSILTEDEWNKQYNK